MALVYINVCKRINTRIFAQGEHENTFKNPIPGIVVNSGITNKPTLSGQYEFYLVSTASRFGMVKPTRYTVVHDSLGAPREHLELLTYKLCHSYFNVAGAISVPAPVQYAHKLAALIGDRAGVTQAAFTRDGTQITSGSISAKPPVVHPRFEEISSLYFI